MQEKKIVKDLNLYFLIPIMSLSIFSFRAHIFLLCEWCVETKPKWAT